MYINIFIENLAKGHVALLELLIPIIAVTFGVLVIIAKNPIVSVLFLIGLFTSVALYLINIGFYFIGLSYILVYVGAISILFLFILMLINVRVSELTTENKNSIALAMLGILFISISVENILPYTSSIVDTVQKFVNYLTNRLENIPSSSESEIMEFIFDSPGHMDNKSWTSVLVENSHITGIGNIIYSVLYVQLIIVAGVLLLAMVGAIVITVKKQ